MSASLPLYAVAGAVVAMATLASLVWLRWRTPSAGLEDDSSLFPGAADYELLFTLSPHPMFVYDIETLRFLAVNDAAVRRYGYLRSEFPRMTLADIRFPEDVAVMKEMVVEAQKSRSTQLPGIWRHRRKDGAPFHVRISGHDLAFAGRAARMVQAIDVSAEVALQAEREQMIAILQQSREWLATAVNAGRIALWERDLTARTLVLGGRWADILGTTAQAFGPVTEQSFLQVCHPADRRRAAARFAAYLKDPARPYVDEFRLRHAREGWVWVLCRGKIAERDSQGRPRRVAGTFVDISQLKAAETARAEQQAAEQASAMKTQFLSRVSHELRTPLNAVIGFSQLLALDAPGSLNAQQSERVAHIEQAGRHLLELINDLMDLSKIELGAVELQSSPVDLQEALEAGLAMVDVQLRERGLVAQREFDPRRPRAQADPLRLRQCVLNLLSNAIKYNRPGGRVSVGTRLCDAARVELWVWNSGPGMTADQLGQLYQAFNRLGREATHSEGSGIGLAISRQLIEHMGGELSATSETGAWACFTARLRAAA